MLGYYYFALSNSSAMCTLACTLVFYAGPGGQSPLTKLVAMGPGVVRKGFY